MLEDDQGSEEGAYHLNHITAKPGPAIQVDLCLNGKPVTMKLDTGAPVSLMCWRMFDRLFPESTLQPCNLPMKTYLGEPIAVRGQAQMEVCYEQQKLTLPLVVVERNSPCLLGRQRLEKLRLNWQSINSV